MHQFKTATHAALTNITARGSASLWFMDKTYNPLCRFEGLHRLLHRARPPITGNNHNDALTLNHSTARIDVFYRRPDNSIDFEVMMNSTNTMQLIMHQTDSILANKIQELISVGSDHCASVQTIQEFITGVSLGQLLFLTNDTPEAHLSHHDLYQQSECSAEEYDTADAALGIQECILCGDGGHIAIDCMKAACPMHNCKGAAGKGHEPKCKSYLSWIKH